MAAKRKNSLNPFAEPPWGGNTEQTPQHIQPKKKTEKKAAKRKTAKKGKRKKKPFHNLNELAPFFPNHGNSNRNTLKPLKVFISYSHKDEKFRQELNAHLSALRRSKLITTWTDRKIAPGADWKTDIDQNLISADLVILLLSANFINSDYCYEVELQTAAKQHQQGKTIILPVLISPLDITATPFSRIQLLPTDGVPIESHRPKSKGWAKVAKEIRSIIENRNSTTSTVRKSAERTSKVYKERHGLIKLIGLDKPIQLKEIFTSVEVVGTDYLNKFATLERMNSEYRKAGDRNLTTHRGKGVDGIEVANENRFLCVLGQPGSGKTTLLKRIGLELTLAEKQRSYQHSLIPVFIELKSFRFTTLNLYSLIERELEICNFPTDFFESALNRGQFLFLFDGLDEVPKEKTEQVIQSVIDFSDRNPENRFIVSCRTAFYQSYFHKFTDVVLADFDNERIRIFSRNWFTSATKEVSGIYLDFLDAIFSDDRRAIQDLAHTPLLLSFLCLVYDQSMRLPDNRSQLYSDALRIILEKWMAMKRIKRDPVFFQFSIGMEMLLLEQLSASAFEKGAVFFRREYALDGIRKFYDSELNAPKHIAPEDLLRAMEVEQGIFVQRAHDIYSFSHLTIQEFLAARHFVACWNDYSFVRKHLLDRRWREIFLLMAGMIQADKLLKAMAPRLSKLRKTSKECREWFRRTLSVVNVRGMRGIQRVSIVLVGFIILRSRSFDYARSALMLSERGSGRQARRDKVLDVQECTEVGLARRFLESCDTSDELLDLIHMEQELGRDISGMDKLKCFSKFVRSVQKLNVFRSGIHQKLDKFLTGKEVEVVRRMRDPENRMRGMLRLKGRLCEAFGFTIEKFEDVDVRLPELEDLIYGFKMIVDSKNAALSVSGSAWEQCVEMIWKICSEN